MNSNSNNNVHEMVNTEGKRLKRRPATSLAAYHKKDYHTVKSLLPKSTAGMLALREKPHL